MKKTTSYNHILLPLISFFFMLSLLGNIYLLKQQSPKETQDKGTVVKQVVDGDTFITEDTIRMRLSNIEAPELGYCGGKEAKDELRELIEGKPVKIKLVGEDVFNRSIALVYIDGALVNKMLVEGGYSRYDGSPSIERDAIREAYQRAVKEKKGIFGPPCRSDNPDKPNCVIKGNINRNPKELIYHYPGCSKYEQTLVEKDLGEQWFCTEKEAQTAGYIKAASCTKPMRL